MNDAQIREMSERLARVYPFPGASGRRLESVLEACTWRRCAAGEQLCEEDDKGATLFFLMSGTVDVFKRDHQRVPQKLATVGAPSLLGHMSLIDRSPRSATCVTASISQIGTMDGPTFERLRTEQSASGTAFRWLLLASLNQQLRRGDARLQELLAEAEAEAEPAPDKAEAQLLHTVGALEGWEANQDERLEPADWKAAIFTQASGLPLGPGATLHLRPDSPVPFELVFEGATPEQTDPVLRRWIRFLHAIPTPPAMVIRFQDCPTDLVPRPKALERRLRLYFPAWSLSVEGDEQVVVTTFSNVDGRWNL